MDLRYSVRMVLKNPGVTAAAVLSLALGIGANATIFTWVKSVLLNPLPAVPEPGRLLVLAPSARDGSERSLSYPNFRDIRDRARTFDLIGQDDTLLSISDGTRADRAFGMLVSGNYFDVVGVKPILGRTFLPSEDTTPSGAPVLVLSHAFWQRRFAGASAVVGQTLKANNRPYTVIGVMPEGFLGTALGLAADAWVPMMQQPELQAIGNRLELRGHSWMQAMARLRPGASVARARAELETIRASLEQEHPTNDGWRLALVPTTESPWGAPSELAPVLLVLAGVAGVLLLIACANVANLMLSKAANRRREIAVRLSLGATRLRIVRQLLAESVLLAALGGAAGMAVAYWSAGLLMLFVPPIDAPIDLGLRVDGRVLLFTFAVAVTTGVLFGLAPALHASNPHVTPVLREESGRASQGAARSRLRNALVVAQVALCLILLVGAGLFLQSLRRAQRLDPGFDADNVVLAAFDLFPAGYDRARGVAFQQRVVEQVRALPGVEHASLAARVPLAFSGRSSTGVNIEGYEPRKDEEVVVSYNEVTAGYFETMQIPVVRGRSFGERDTAAAPPVLVINETMARRYWGTQDPVGRYVRIGKDRTEVVGVVKDGKYRSFMERPTPYMYFPLPQSYRSASMLHVRTSGTTDAMFSAIRVALRELDPDLPLFQAMTMRQSLEQAVFAQRIGATLLSIFGALALTLAAVGLYSVMSYAVTQRTHEMGIRLALGASPLELRKMVVRSGMGVAAIGLAIGAAGAAGVSQLLTSLLNGVSPTDPLTFGAVIAILALVAFAAAFIPARRASSVDPIVALRYE
ncbi:MAG: ABC transporter permease [Vicinamibacterales bacterium]